MDLSGLDATPAEVGALMDAIVEAEAEADTWGGAYDADDQAAADWAASLSDAEFAELLAGYEADSHLPGPELAGAGSEGAIDLAAEMSAIDMVLAAQTDREHQRQVQDAAESGRRGSTEIRLANALGRLGRGTYLYGQEPAADLASTWGGPGADDLFSGPTATPHDVAAEMAYQINGGLAPAPMRPRVLPPVQGLAARIGLR